MACEDASSHLGPFQASTGRGKTISLADNPAPKHDRKAPGDDPGRKTAAAANLGGLGGWPDNDHVQAKHLRTRSLKAISFRESTSPEPELGHHAGSGSSPATKAKGRRGHGTSRRHLARDMGCDFSDSFEIRRRRAFVKDSCEEAGHPLNRPLTFFSRLIMDQIIDAVHAAVNNDDRSWGWSKGVTKKVMMAVATDNWGHLKKIRRKHRRRNEPSGSYKGKNRVPEALRAATSSSSTRAMTAAAAAAAAATTATAHSPPAAEGNTTRPASNVRRYSTGLATVQQSAQSSPAAPRTTAVSADQPSALTYATPSFTAINQTASKSSRPRRPPTSTPAPLVPSIDGGDFSSSDDKQIQWTPQGNSGTCAGVAGRSPTSPHIVK